MYTCTGRFCHLEELTTNTTALFHLISANEADYRSTVSDQTIPKTLIDFERVVISWFSKGRNFQFLVNPKNCQETVGTIFFYGHNENKIRMSCYFQARTRGTLIVSESLCLTISFAVKILAISEILFSVYKENAPMHRLALKLGAMYLEEKQSTVNPERFIVEYTLQEMALANIVKKLERLAKH